MAAVLEVSGLRKDLRGFSLRDVSFRLEAGSVMGLIGTNGAGKTTTIRMIMGLMRKDAGSIRLFGREMGPDDAESRQRIGFVYDEPSFYGGMTAAAAGALVAPFYRTWRNEVFGRLLEEFRIDPRGRTGAMSRGQRTRLALAIALAHDAELIVMDEPTSGLDPVFRAELLDNLRTVMRDERKAILYSTHITSDLERFADFITFIDQGRVLLAERSDELRDRYWIVRGPVEKLDAAARELCAGIRETAVGFEALSSHPEDLAALVGADAVVDRADLDDIMVYLAGRHR